jgi:predicted DNA-binding helix-hairpin-helix protein
VEVNRADYEVLLRVPGIGIRSAKRIVRLRRQHRLSFDDLPKLGVVLKRARLFVTASGKRLEQLDLSTSAIRARLCEPAPQRQRAEQLPLFPFAQLDLANVISGEL